jgi:dTDP-4-amino-4,6-dideoxygalactose transaminase
MIPVTKPFLPPQEEYNKFLDGIWQRNWLTNNGPLVNEFELKLKKKLNSKHLLFLSNGTIAIQIALKALAISKEVITTPFSYVATTSSLVWEGSKPAFVDIDTDTLNIDPKKIEEAITPDTQAILATHCFGNACDIDAIDAIAQKHGLKVIYDAAHCFGSFYKEKPVFLFGDVSTTSFHATKLFHTVEGGAVFTSDPELLRRMAYMRNFGHDGPEKFSGVGINGKNSEFHAAMGLCNLKYIDGILAVRQQQCELYDSLLENLEVQRPMVHREAKPNYSYYPVIFNDEATAMQMKGALEAKEIFPRRYFFPTLSDLNYVAKYDTPIADSIASRILCLPLYYSLSEGEQDIVARVLLRTQNYGI